MKIMARLWKSYACEIMCPAFRVSSSNVLSWGQLLWDMLVYIIYTIGMYLKYIPHAIYTFKVTIVVLTMAHHTNNHVLKIWKLWIIFRLIGKLKICDGRIHLRGDVKILFYLTETKSLFLIYDNNTCVSSTLKFLKILS